MAWCPKCKNEYREGFTVCADCGCELVAEESVEPVAEEQITEEQITEEQITEEQITERQMQEQFMAQVADTAPKARQIVLPYKASSELAEENRSSGWVLLIIGGIGLLIMILGIMGIIPFRLGNQYLFYGVMMTVFILFIVMGVLSMKNAKIFAKKAESENNLRDTLLKWCEENLKAEKVDAQLEEAEEHSEEMLYFMRYEILKKMINHQFMNLDQAFLEKLIDDKVYDMVFGEN